MSIAGHNILLTGGLGSLGTAQAQLFAEEGATVYVLDLDEARGAAYVAGLNRSAGRDAACFVQCDLNRLDDARALVENLSAEVGGFHVLINNAALITHKPFEEFSTGEYEDVVRVNSSAGFVLTQAVAPAMKERGYGRVVNFCSITMNGRWEQYVPYVASKGALFGLTKTLARALGPHGITVNAVSPGCIVSDAERRIFGDKLEEYNRWALENQSVKRRGEPIDVARLVLFLIQPETSFLTGQNIEINGGW